MGRSMDELHDTVDKACAILKKTDDGNDLDPGDLKLIEHAANGHLSEEGREIFEKLYRRVVIDGTYIRPYLHDIEHITRDHDGYIYYKGIHVEHYDRDWVYSEDAKNSLLELKRRCEFLERKGMEVSCGNAVWGWGIHADEYGVERLRDLDALLGAYGLQYSRVEIYCCGREFSYYVCGHPGNLEEIKGHPVTQSMIGRYSINEYEITVGNFILSHKTDFAEGYEKIKLLDGLINSPDRSLPYSEVLMYGSGMCDLEKMYAVGVPSFDDVKEYPEYQALLEYYGDNLTVSMTMFQCGGGEPLTPDEIYRLQTAPFIEALGKTHCHLQQFDLSNETGRRDFTRDIEVRRGINPSHAEPDEEAEDGYEP